MCRGRIGVFTQFMEGLNRKEKKRPERKKEVCQQINFELK